MIFIRFLFSYMFVLVGVESLLLIGGRRSDRDFFFGVLAALVVTLIWRLLRSVAALRIAVPAPTVPISRPLRPPVPRVPARPRPLHGPSPSR